MRLSFKPFDGRGFNHEAVIDEDTGQQVGYIRSGGVGPYGTGGISVWLFDGKYRIDVRRFDQAWGFVKGVEAVLCQVASLTDTGASKQPKQVAA